MSGTDVITTIAVSLTSSGIINWLIKSYWDQQFKKELVTFENDLKKDFETYKLDLDKKLASYQSDLSKQNLSWEEIRGIVNQFQQIIDEITTAIERMAIISTTEIDAPIPSEAERSNIAAEAYNRFNSFFQQQRIYLPPNAVEKIQLLADLYRRTIDNFRFRMRGLVTMELNREIRLATTEQIPQARESVNEVFRELTTVR